MLHSGPRKGDMNSWEGKNIEDIFNFRVFFPCSEMFHLGRRSLGWQESAARLSGALGTARAEL